MENQETSGRRYARIPWLHLVLLLLAGVSGSIDAMGYLELGHVLTANMTGTTVLLGIAAGQGQLLSATKSLAALLGFMTGVGIGTMLIIRREASWVRILSVSLGVECILVVAMAALWLAFMHRHNDFAVFSCIALSSVAMGMQSAAIRHLKIPGIVTTYISGTITAVVAGIVKHFRSVVSALAHPGEGSLPPSLETRMGLQWWVFSAYGGTAALTAFVYLKGMRFLPLLPLVMILCVLGILGKHRETT